MVGLIIIPYWITMVGIVVSGFDRLCMCDMGHGVVPKMMAKCENGVKKRCLGIVVRGP